MRDVLLRLYISFFRHVSVACRPTHGLDALYPRLLRPRFPLGLADGADVRLAPPPSSLPLPSAAALAVLYDLAACAANDGSFT